MKSLLHPDLDQLWTADPSVLTAARIKRALNKPDSISTISMEKAVEVRVAFIGSFTLDTIRDTFEIACLHEGIRPAAFLGQYKQYPQELLDPTSALYQHKPDITFLHLDPRSVFGAAYEMGSAEGKGGQGASLNDMADAFLSRLIGLAEQFSTHDAGILVIHNLDEPAYDFMGIHASSDGSVTAAVCYFNAELLRRTREFSRVYVLNYNRVASKVGKDIANDEKLRLLGSFCVGHAAVPSLVHQQIGYVKAVKGLTRKCTVLDLDNTLWGGIIGEDGFDGIALGSTPPGNAFVEFQRTLLGFYRRGVILAVCSRNNPDDALQVLRNHPDQILREEHFAALDISWDDKALGIMRIAKSLNIGLDSLVFIDDDTHNRALVREALPQVLTLELPQDPSLYRRALLQLNDFEVLALTQEDRQRGRMYAAERAREATRTSSTNLDDFLLALETRVQIRPVDAFAVPRVSQLTQRTNQFNMTTRRYTPADIEQFGADPNKKVLCLSVSDKYGDSGLVGVAIVNGGPKVWEIDTLLMSCRVLGRRIENAFLWDIAQRANDAGASEIRGEVIFTPKNLPAREFYTQMGFAVVESNEAHAIYLAKVAELVKSKPVGVTFE
ncbi:MAG: HAD-IIIC family phosphatase [Phycisphaerae bacterium]|nr:HAD-IIIC family phosphatase [Phycisphaerae bacterium]